MLAMLFTRNWYFIYFSLCIALVYSFTCEQNCQIGGGWNFGALGTSNWCQCCDNNGGGFQASCYQQGYKSTYCVSSGGNSGVDVSTLVQNSWSCIASQGYSFAIVRSYRSDGIVDSNAVATIKNAAAAGLRVDAYHFPNIYVNAAQQIRDNLNNLASNGASIGTLWLDVEGTWQDCNTNKQFLQNMVNQAQSMGARVGIYTSAYYWGSIMCSSQSFAYLPLWYAYYDGVANFNEFQSFGGWGSPAIKQFDGSHGTHVPTVCGVSVDLNYGSP